MDLKQEQHAVIEFLFLEGRTGEAVAIRLRDMSGEPAYSRATVFQRINRVRNLDTRPTVKSTTSSETIHSPHCG
jgi:hypothetical protein